MGEFHLDDPLLDRVWGVLEDAGTPVVLHAGSGPVGNGFTGPASTDARARRSTRGWRWCSRTWARRRWRTSWPWPRHYDNVRLDTTMVFTDFFPPYPRELLPRLADLGHKILLGTDFPTIPYPYAHQLEGLARLDLGDDWLRQVCWENGAALFGCRRRWQTSIGDVG